MSAGLSNYFFLVLCLVCFPPVQAYQDRGEPCAIGNSSQARNETETCDPSKPLICLYEVCHDNCPDRSNYDSSGGKCIYPVSYEAGSDETVYPCPHCPELGECVDRSTMEYSSAEYPYKSRYITVNQTWCVCVNGSFRVGPACFQSKSFGEACIVDEECRKDYESARSVGVLACVDRKCGCPQSKADNSSSTYDPQLGQCVAYPNQPCTFPSFRQYEATKYQYRYSYGGDYHTESLCIGNSYCARIGDYGYNHQCVCYGGDASLAPDGKACLAGFHEDCSPTIRCNPDKGLSCTDGLCDCRSPTYQVYDRAAELCFYKLGSPCEAISPNSTCEKHGVCVDGTCQCEPGRTLSLDGRICYKDYGEECLESHYYSGYHDCNTEQGLKCIHGKCLCGDCTVGRTSDYETIEACTDYFHYNRTNSSCDTSVPLPKIRTSEDMEELIQNLTLKRTAELRQNSANQNGLGLSLGLVGVIGFAWSGFS